MTIEQIKQQLPTLDVWVANVVAFGLTLSNVETILSIIALTVAISYSIWRWIKEYKAHKNGS